MKRISYLIALFVLSLVAASAFGQRKLPAKAYLTSAKIHVTEGRPEEAVAMLDSLFIHYGPHSEGLALIAQIMVDFLNKAPTTQEKTPYVDKMVAYIDSLRLCCSNEKIESKFRKDCDKLLQEADQTELQFWREFYNKGLEQLKSLQEFAQELSNAQDSLTISDYTKAIEANADSSISNMQAAIKIDQADYRPYVAIGSILEGQKKFEDANQWLLKGLAYTDDSASLELSIAYNSINLDKYCDAVPHFEQYFRKNPSDLPNANNLAICYIKCEKYSDAVATYHKILEVDSNHSEALYGLGNFYRRDAGELNKKAKSLSDEKKEAESKAARDKAFLALDTAAQYYGRHIKAYPDSLAGYDEYGLISSILGKYDKAAETFKKLTELQPDKVENWISLGDSYFSLKDLKNAIPGYEKAVELSPDRKILWERLSFLYLETGNADKRAKADKEVLRLEN